MDDLDRDRRRWIGLELVPEAQVDDALDAVVDELAPPGLGEPPHAVRTHDGAERRLAAVLGRMPAEVAHVRAAVPGQVTLACGHRR